MYELSTLNNGLRVLTVTMPYFQSVSLGFFIGVGSRYEPETLAGASHFVEHMLFKGTERRPCAREIAEAIEGKGGVFNASTGLELTLYWAKVAADHLPVALDVLSDMLLNAAFDEAEVEKERAVICEEISYSTDMPDSLAQIMVNQLQWPDHPLGRDVAGTQDSVALLGRDNLRAFQKAHYRPGNTILSLAGLVDHAEVVKMVEAHLGDWEPGPRMAYEPAPPNHIHRAPRVQTAFRETDQAQLSFSFPGLSRDDPDSFSLRLLNIVLGEGMRSRLFQEIRERLGLAYSVGSYISNLQDSGSVGLFASVATDRVAPTLRAILDQIERLRQEPVPDAELQSARDFIKGRFALSLEDSFTLASWYARQTLLQRQVLSPKDTMDRLDATTPQDIQRLAQALLRPEYMNLAAVGRFSDNGDGLRQMAQF